MGCGAPKVTGKFLELTSPVTEARPEESTAIAVPVSDKLPPKKLEYTSADPLGLSLVTNAAVLKPVLGLLRWNAPVVVGKSEESV